MCDRAEVRNDFLRQQVMQAKCEHPTGTFIAFRQEEIEQSVPARFEQQVARYPERLAVKSRTHALTYAELNHMANRVAQAILACRGERAEPVALLFGKGAPLIVSTLGALKAGKIYMPLDPSFPPARLTYMLEDAQAGLLVTHDAHLTLAHALAQNKRQILNIDALERHFSTANPRLHISPDALACLFYTSGSTGQPKGVVDTHRNSLHFTRIQTNTFHICAHDRVTFLASQGRDIFQSLLNGATVYPIDITQEGLAPLAPWLLQEGVTIYYSAASVFRYFVHTLSGEEQFPALRLIVLIGEPLSKRDVELYQQHFAPHCMVVNSLGGTETLPFRYYFVDKQTQITSSVVPAGYAVADKEVLLVDEAGQAVGYNRPGEIVVKSRYLSPGYWRRPELTAMKFLPDPTGGNERLYRTGDLGVMRPDGCLVYLGRQDSQVKIRGHRIELAEIEMALLDLDTVKEAVVVAQEDTPGHQRLVGYIVPAGPATPTVSALRQALAETLPAYMIPSAFVMLDRLPLIGIGKVDRRTLPAPNGARPELDTPFAMPRTPVEAALARIWAETLGLTQVGIYDEFLALGGDSLLATQIIAQIINTLRVELAIRSLFEASTVADMALLITQSQAERVGPEAIERMLTELAAVSKAAGPSPQCLQ